MGEQEEAFELVEGPVGGAEDLVGVRAKHKTSDIDGLECARGVIGKRF